MALHKEESQHGNLLEISMDTCAEDDTPQDVHSPVTPHPGTMSPPPPPGEPPRLLRNKRPIGVLCFGRAADVDQTMAGWPTVPPGSSTKDAHQLGDSDGASALTTADSSSNSGDDVEDAVPAPNEPQDWPAPEILCMGKQQLDKANPQTPDAPEMPPGPPPAKMAPPPPSGPPPSLPLERADLKRAYEEPINSPIGKRLRAVTLPDGLSLEDANATFTVETSTCCAPDDEFLTDTTAQGTSGKAPQGSGRSKFPGCNNFEASYEEAPASARWVWDRILQQAASNANAARLETRMIRALDALNFGTEGACSWAHDAGRTSDQ